MRPNNSTEIQESRPLRAISMSSFRKLLPKSMSSSKQQLKQSILSRSRTMDDENAPPVDPNIEVMNSQSKSLSSRSKSPSKLLNSSVKEVKLVQSEHSGCVSAEIDPAVKVIVRVRPQNSHERRGDLTIAKASHGSLTLADRNFCFDSILDSQSKQEDVFRLVGEPLVRDALAGYNTSILCYGQSGTGKTYTMWGPPSAMVEGHSPSTQRGIAPRIFKKLFSQIERVKENCNGMLMNFQCRCSFLEIYNGQLGDLLDSTRRNLEIRDDSKNCFYIENLTEEFVTGYDDLTQILIKGLSSRKVGATGSLSHIVFTCVVESWCKETQSNSISSSKTSRISLIDLAGMDKMKQESSEKELQLQNKNVKKSLSNLGHIVSMLAKGTQPEDVVYRNSCLTHLLQDSFGGNSKLSVICTISSDEKSCGETLSSLRFGQQVRTITNKPVINEITEDDVNDLSDQIRQLKEELLRAKLDVGNPARMSNPSLIKARSVRESVNQLRMSLNRSLILPSFDDNSDEKIIEHDEVDVAELCKQLNELHKSVERNPSDLSCFSDSMNFASARESSDSYFTTEHQTDCLHESDTDEVNSAENSRSISVNASPSSPVLEDPPFSESPKIKDLQRNSIMKSSILSQNKNSPAGNSQSSITDAPMQKSLVRQSESVPSNLRSSRFFSGPTESLEASLKRGLEIIDYHQKKSQSVRSSSAVAFSFEHLMLKPSPAADEANASVQTLSGKEVLPISSLCTSCKQKKVDSNVKEVQDSLKDQEVEGVSHREKELVKFCDEQAAKIEELTMKMLHFKQKTEDQITEAGNTDQEPEIIKEACDVEEMEKHPPTYEAGEKEELLKEIHNLKSRLQAYTDPATTNKSIDKLRTSLLARSMQLRKSLCVQDFNSEEEFEKERVRWTEMESEWINLTDELRMDLESNRQRAEQAEMELRQEKKCTEELDDALDRAVLGHGRIVEHYVDLQEKYDDLAEKHRQIMEYISEVKRAAEKARGKKGEARFAKAVAAELSASRVQKDKERDRLKKENRILKLQLRDTAEAVHTAGELLVRLREAEEAASVAEGNFNELKTENEKLRKQINKIKKKHQSEMDTMKQYMAESKLPQSALQPPMRFSSEPEITPFNETDTCHYDDDDDDAWRGGADTSSKYDDTSCKYDDDEAWRAEFGAIYQDHHF